MPWKTVRRKLGGNTRWQWSRESLDKPTEGDFLHGDRVRLQVEAHHESGLLYVEVSKPKDHGQLETCFDFAFAELERWISDNSPDQDVHVSGRNTLYLRDSDGDTHKLPKDLVMALAGLEAA